MLMRYYFRLFFRGYHYKGEQRTIQNMRHLLGQIIDIPRIWNYPKTYSKSYFASDINSP